MFAARQALAMMDLTRLEEGDDDAFIERLCQRAATQYGTVAAVCVYPQWIGTARTALHQHGLVGKVAVATVINFPDGDQDADRVVQAIQSALAAGADEIDLVFPWRALRDGDAQAGRDLVAAARAACPDHVLKVILETGELAEPSLIRQAAEIAVASGADFLKTSTGKVAVNATPEAARILLEVIRESGRNVGCKVSGGIRTAEQAREYFDLAANLMGADWLGPEHFRFGASGLLDDLLATLGNTESTSSGAKSY